MKRAPNGKKQNSSSTKKPKVITKATPVPKVMMEVEKSSYIKLVRTVRDLEAENDKLVAHMKIISEAARESQTRSRVYSQREEAPAHKRVHGGNGKSVQRGNAGQVLRGKDALSVDGIQIPILNSTPYKPRFTKSPSKTKPTPAEMAQKGTSKRY